MRWTAVHPSLLLLLVSVASTLITRLVRLLRPQVSLHSSLKYAQHIKVLLSSTPDRPWQETVWHLLSRSAYPSDLCVRVLLRCRSVDEVHHTVLDSELKGKVQILHVPHGDRGDGVASTVSELAVGDEHWVCVVDDAVRVLPGWDRRLFEHAPGDRILSIPQNPEEFRPGFPTLAEDGGRGGTRPFHRTESGVVLPSVALCSEFAMATPATWKAKEPKHAVPAFLVLERFHPRPIERTPRPGVQVFERIGLTRSPPGEEAIYKFGSIRAATLAIDFERVR